jgi:hypothetical protein
MRGQQGDQRTVELVMAWRETNAPTLHKL